MLVAPGARANTSEAVRQYPAPGELAKLALDEAGKSHAVRRAGPRILEDVQQVRAHKRVAEPLTLMQG